MPSVIAPKKYADRDRTVVTDEWIAWREDWNLAQAEETRARIRSFGDEESYYPEDFDKDLGDGSWVFVIDPPHGVQHDFHVPVLSIWYAKPHLLDSGLIGDRAPYQGIIQTPAGDLHLWPREYALCGDVTKYLGFEGVQIHSLGGDPVLDEEQVWYLMSRGISQQDAVNMLFSQIKSQNYCYVTLPGYAVAMFAGVGTSLRSHVSRAHSLLDAPGGTS